MHPDRLRATVEKLAAFPTRNSLSPFHREAAAWIASEFASIPHLQVEAMEYTLPEGRRVPRPTPATQVIATLPGRSERCVLVGAHFDSLNLSVDPLEGPAPGANDNASGVAAVLECARTLAGPLPLTVKFVAFSGEEQGLLGARALAERAVAEGWPLEAVLNLDTIGSSGNLSGQSDPTTIRLFSEEGTSRELARWIEWSTRSVVPGFGVKLVLRKDRFGRGGDHTPFQLAGFPAVRFVETHEEYRHQHTPDDRPENMDFAHLMRVTTLVTHAVDALAGAGEPPRNAQIVMEQGHDTRITWEGEGPMRVFWRDTRSAVWEASEVVSGGDHVVHRVNKDDHCFALGAESGVPIALN